MSIYNLTYRNSSPGTSGGFNTTYSSIFDRLYSPEEFDNLPSGQKTAFQNYMDYVTQFQKQKRISDNSQSRGTQRVPQGGSWSVAGAGTPISTSGSSKQTATASKMPSYKIHRDISGNVSYEPVGGTRRTITGEIIPQTLESVQSGLQLGTAIPTMEAQSELNLQKLQAELAQARAAEKSPKALMEQQRVAQRDVALQQTALRTQLAQQKEDNLNKRFYKAQDWKEANAIAQREFNQSQAEYKAKIQKERDLFNAEERKELSTLNSEQSLYRAKEIIAARIAAEEPGEKQKRLNSIQDTLNATLSRLELAKIKSPEEFEMAKNQYAQAVIGATTRAGQATTAVNNQPPAGAKQAADGKWYVQQNGKWYLWQP